MKALSIKVGLFLIAAALIPSAVYANANSSIGLDQEALLYTAFHRGMLPISQIQLPDDSNDDGLKGSLESLRTVARVITGYQKFKFFQDGEYYNCKVDIHNTPNLRNLLDDGKASVRIHDCDGGAKFKLKAKLKNGSTKIVEVSEIEDRFDISVAHNWYQNLKPIDKNGLIATQKTKEINRSPAIDRVFPGGSVASQIDY